MAKDNKKKSPKKSPLEPIKLEAAEPPQTTPETPIEPIDVREGELDIAADIEGSEITDADLADGSGLLDLSLKADDTALGDVFDEIYGPEEMPPQGPSKRVQQAQVSLEQKIIHHDGIMQELEFNKVGKHHYSDGIRNIVFVREESGARVHIAWGYSLKNIVPDGSTMKDLRFVAESKKAKGSYTLFDELALKYLAVHGRKKEGRYCDNTNSRVAFGYSVAYSPDSEGLKDRIGALIATAKGIYRDIKKEIEENLGGGKTIIEIPGKKTTKLFSRGWRVYKREQETAPQVEIAQPAQPTSPEVQALTTQYETTQKPKIPPPAEKHHILRSLYKSTIGRLFKRGSTQPK